MTMENPLWHRALAVEALLAKRRKYSPTTGVRLSHDEVDSIATLLANMRKELP
jgi:hypothetical protein